MPKARTKSAARFLLMAISFLKDISCVHALFPSLTKREHDERRCSRASMEPGDHARGRGDVLLAVDLVGDDAAAHGAAGVEPVEDRAVRLVEHQEVVVIGAG